MTGFVSLTHQVNICCDTNSCSELDNQNISCASKRVPVTIATVYITWVSFYTISLVLFLFSSLLFAPAFCSTFLFAFPDFSSLFV